MRPIWIIAANTFREIIRDRILYGIVVFALLLFGLSLALGQLSFSEQAKISADFGFAGIQIGACVLAVFVGSTLVAKEIEKQTILTLLARPISRSQFLLGKFLGLSMVIITVMAGLAAVLAALTLFLGLNVDGAFAVALLGAFFEALLLLSVALFFGTFARPMMTAIFSLSVFLIGHWVESLEGFMKKSDSNSFKAVAKAIGYVFPDLERFNWRDAPVYGLEVPALQVAFAGMYAAAWVVALLALTSIIFRRRDFV